MAKQAKASDDAAGKSGHDRPRFQPALVVALTESRCEARAMLDPLQYWETVLLVRRLTDFGDRAATSDLDVRQFGDFYELRIKGGFVKRLNIRVYFAFVGHRREVVILKTYKKEEDRRTCPSIMDTLDDRLEDYLDGKCSGVSTYRREAG